MYEDAIMFLVFFRLQNDLILELSGKLHCLRMLEAAKRKQMKSIPFPFTPSLCDQMSWNTKRSLLFHLTQLATFDACVFMRLFGIVKHNLQQRAMTRKKTWLVAKAAFYVMAQK